MENLSRNMEKNVRNYDYKKNGKKKDRRSLVFVGEFGHITPAGWVKGLLYFFIFAFLVAAGAAGACYYLYQSVLEQNRVLKTGLKKTEQNLTVMKADRNHPAGQLKEMEPGEAPAPPIPTPVEADTVAEKESPKTEARDRKRPEPAEPPVLEEPGKPESRPVEIPDTPADGAPDNGAPDNDAPDNGAPANGAPADNETRDDTPVESARAPEIQPEDADNGEASSDEPEAAELEAVEPVHAAGIEDETTGDIDTDEDTVQDEPETPGAVWSESPILAEDLRFSKRGKRVEVDFNIKKREPDDTPITGHAVVVLKTSDTDVKNAVALPDMELVSGSPTGKQKGEGFKIARFRTLNFKARLDRPLEFQKAVVFIFDFDGNIMLKKEFAIGAD